MLHFKKTLFISALAISLAACSTNSETPTTSTSPTDSPAISSSSSPSPENTGSPDSAASPNAGEKRFAQEVQLVESLKSGKVGETTKIPVIVKNTSNFVWNNTSANPVNFSYNWFDSNGNRVVWDGERTALTKSLAPQDSEKISAVIKLPDRPGNYILTLTMVQEGVTWFNDAGAQAPKIPVTVTSQ